MEKITTDPKEISDTFNNKGSYRSGTSLPKEVAQARMVNEFKARIDEQWKDEHYTTPFD